MAYSYDQIIKAYTELHVGKAPDRATADSLILTTSMNQSGQLSDAQVVSILVNGADDTTAVAVMSYQFFTGKSPTAAGLTYLVNSATNTTDLNDGYYSKFNLENRYINFAANLGLYGEGAIAFASKYGAMDFNTYVASIYETIIGRSYAEAASVNVDAAISYLIGTRDAVLQTVREAGLVTANSSAAQIDLAVKAAMAGLVMAASIKADVGLYAAATDNFMVALTQGNAVYNTDITVSYRPSYDTAAHGTGHAVDRGPSTLPNPVTTTPVTPVTHSFTLGAGANYITGTAQDDTFTGTNTTFHASDVLNGGGGADTLTLTSNTGSSYLVPVFTNVTNIETINLSSNAGITANLGGASMAGVQNLNVTASGSTYVYGASNVPTDISVTVNNAATNNTFLYNGHNDTVTVNGATTGRITVNTQRNGADANLGDIVVTRTTTGDVSAGQITVYGGGTVKITQIATNAVNTTQTNGLINVYGGVGTTSVEVNAPTPVTADGTHAGVTGNSVIISDYYTVNGGLGTLTTVKIDGFQGGGFNGPVRVISNSLTDLTLAHGAGDVFIDTNRNFATGYATTLSATFDAVTLGQFWDHDSTSQYTTLAIATGSTASSIADLDFEAATQLTVSGSGSLNVTSLASSTQLHTATVTGTASLTATFGAGDDTITLGAGASVIDTGAGNDQVIVTAANAASNTVFSTLNLSPGGDTLKINAQGGAAAFTGVMGASATGATFQDLLNSAASGDGHTTSRWGTFQFGGDTYIVLDSSASATFQAGTDIVVKLVGAYNETGATITNGVLTIQ